MIMTMTRDFFRQPSFHSGGFTLIEVLVAIVILSIGLLGLAGLQAASIRNTGASGQRSVAINLAMDISDRMRANPSGLANGDYIYDYGGAANASGVQTATCGTTAGCTVQELARNDIFQWNAALLAQLPQPAAATVAGVVCVDSTPDDGTPAAPACDDAVFATTGAGGTAVSIARTAYSGRLPYVIKIWWVEDRNNPNAQQKRLSVRFEP